MQDIFPTYLMRIIILIFYNPNLFISFIHVQINTLLVVYPEDFQSSKFMPGYFTKHV